MAQDQDVTRGETVHENNFCGARRTLPSTRNDIVSPPGRWLIGVSIGWARERYSVSVVMFAQHKPHRLASRAARVSPAIGKRGNHAEPSA